MIIDWEFNFVDGHLVRIHWSKIHISFEMSVLVTKLHFLVMAVSLDTIVIGH